MERRARREIKSTVRVEPIAVEPLELEARGFDVKLPNHSIYGDDASDPGTRLLAELVELGESHSVLVFGGGSGLLPTVAARLATSGRVAVFADQLPEAAQVEEAIRLNRVTNARVVRGADLIALRAERFDVALLGTTFEPSRGTLVRHIQETALLLRPGGRLYLHGGKREGIESAAAVLRDVFGNVTTLAYRKGHRVLLAERQLTVRAEWEVVTAEVVGMSVSGEALEVETRPGLFAGGALDEGTRLLVESIDVRPTDEALDLGCGSGIVGLMLARRAREGRVWLVDSDLGAVELARRNLARNKVENADVGASDVYSALGERRFDLIATNPPFHVGRIQTTEVVKQFIAEAPAHLRPGGRFYLVANLFLKYESLFPVAFEAVEVVAETSRYKVLRARIGRPRDRRLREPDAESDWPRR